MTEQELEDFEKAAAEVKRTGDSLVAQVGDRLILFLIDDNGVLKTEELL